MRAWPARRVALGVVVGLLLLSAALLGRLTPLQAQEGEAAAPQATAASGVSLRLDDLVHRITYTIVDRLEIQLAGLEAAATYEVRVSSDHAARLGVGGCGTAAQTQTVTGATTQGVYFIVYACGLGQATVTAEVRRAGASAAEVTVNQDLTVQPIPDYVPAGQRPATGAGAAGAVARVGTPGIVPNVRFPDSERNARSFKVAWDKPADGGRALTGYGVLQRRQGQPWPAFRDADVVGGRSKTYRGLQPNTTYEVRVHACNGPDSCGWWTGGTSVTTRREPTVTPGPTTGPTPTSRPVGPPGPPHALRATTRDATALTVGWSAATATGGAPLTGFGLLQWETPGPRPPDRDATVVGAATRSQSFTGLKYGRAQQIQIRACNGPNRCSAWASLTVPALPPPLPSIHLPKTTLAIGERMSVGAYDVPVGAVAHLQVEGPIQPEGRCAAGATGADAVGAAPSPSTGPGYYDSMWIEGCAPGGATAVVRLESPDGAVLYDRRTLTVATAATERPGRVGVPGVTGYNAALGVSWSAPTSGGAPTHYDVRHRVGTSGAWTQQRSPDHASMILAPLSNGVTYQVEVRACNGHGCSEKWSETATGTPLATAPATTDPPASITPVNADCPETSLTATAAGPPQNLDVVPAAQRHILLCWTPVTPVTGTTSYLVQVTLNPTADTDDDRAWVAARTRKPGASGPASTTETAVTVDLTNVLLHTADRGLTTQQSIGFRIRAKIDSARYEYSDMVVVVDSPIVAASVFSSNRTEAHVSWRTAQTVLLDDDYTHGTYDLRYRLVRGNRQDRNWTPEDLGPREIKTGVSSPLTMRELAEDRIYAIQLVYRKDNRASTHDADVYAARNVYVQTIEGPPVEYESLGPVVFAGFPMQFPMKTTTFDYRVCTETFPTGRESDWVDFIRHAFGQWALATNYTVISMHYNSASCTDYASTEVTRTILDKIKHHTGSNEDLTAEVQGFIRQATTMTKLRPLHHADSRLNEVVMLNDTEALGLGPAYKSRVVWVYSQLGSDIGYLGSKGRESTNRKCWTEFPGCAVPSLIVDSDGVATGDGYSTDIFLLRSKVSGNLQIPGGDTSLNRSDVKLNQCPAGTSDTYGILVHEVGHALGLRSADGSDVHHRLSDSVMSGGNYGEKCSPYPLDVLAIRALYETR